MPTLNEVVPETKQSVIRPIVLEVIRQIANTTQISPNVSILYADDIGVIHQPGSALQEDRERTLFPFNDRIQVDVTEEFDPDAVLSTAISRPENILIFKDDNLGVSIAPVYIATTISIDFKFNAVSKTQALRWRDDIRMRASTMRDINLHSVSYHYIIPSCFITLLEEIYRLRENEAGYGDSFKEYLVGCSTKRLTEVTNLSAGLVAPAIAETQSRIVGYFDFDAFPEKAENSEDSTGWISSFSYKFKIEKPIACNMRYPVMVHNQVLSANFRPAEESYNLNSVEQAFSMSIHAFNYFESQLQADIYSKPVKTITIPPFDEFTPVSILSGTVSIFSALCQLDDNQPNMLFNLKELGDVLIDPDILVFIEAGEYKYLTKAYQSIFNVSLYRGNHLAGEGSLIIKPNLDVVSTIDLNKRINHRVRFSIVADIDYLSKATLSRLKTYPGVLIKTLSAVNDSLRSNPGFLDLGNKRQITEDDLNRFIRNKEDRSQTVKMNTVMTSYVVAERLSALNP
jgi:hypothetical protein